MAQANAFWDKMALRYSKSPVSDQASYEIKLEKTQAYLNSDMDVLEFGCGTGSTALIHAPFVNHIHAVDISKNMLEIGRSKAATANVKNLTFERASIEELDVKDGTYDAAMGHSILHLLADKDAALAKVYRTLKPGGLFISSTPCLVGWMLILKAILPIGRYFGWLPLVTFFSEKELMESLRGVGFEIEHHWQPANGKALFVIARKPV